MAALSRVKDLDFTIIVAGSEDYFTEADLDEWAAEYGISDRLHKDIRFIPEAVKNAYLDACDAVILPYRSMFSGISGPLTEGPPFINSYSVPITVRLDTRSKRMGSGTRSKQKSGRLGGQAPRLLNRLHRGSMSSVGVNTASMFARFIRDEKLFGETYRKFLA